MRKSREAKIFIRTKLVLGLSLKWVGNGRRQSDQGKDGVSRSIQVGSIERAPKPVVFSKAWREINTINGLKQRQNASRKMRRMNCLPYGIIGPVGATEPGPDTPDKRTQEFSKIVMDNTRALWYSPDDYSVFVSKDGMNLGTPIASGRGLLGITTSTFPTQTARDIRTTQTGTNVTCYRSVYEFDVFAADERAGPMNPSTRK